MLFQVDYSFAKGASLMVQLFKSFCPSNRIFFFFFFGGQVN